MPHCSPALLGKLLPAFAAEIKASLFETNWGGHLIEQVDKLPIVGMCGCGWNGCSSFYSALCNHEAPVPKSRNTGGMVPVNKGLVILDVLEGKIVFVEIQQRRDVFHKLHDLFPLSDGQHRIWSYPGDEVRYRPSTILEWCT